MAGREIPGTGGVKSYGGDPASKPAPQTVYPKAQGGAPPAVKKEVPGTGGVVSYGGPKPAAAAPESQNSFLYDFTHPQAADLSRPQSWRDWLTKTYDPSAKQIGTAAIDDLSFGYADPVRSHFTGENLADLRANTADAQAALGPGAPIINAATYVIPGMGAAKVAKALGTAGRVTGALGRYGAAGLEGGTSSAAGSYGHQAFDPEHPVNYTKLATDTLLGTGLGVGGQAAGDTVAAVARPILDKVTGKPGRSSEQWDWRRRAGRDPDSVRAEVAGEQALRPPNDPAQPSLARTQEALGQSVEPGVGFDAAAAATGALATKFGLDSGMHFGEAVVPGGIAGGTVRWLGDRTARGINTIDRNINVGQALDKLYPALYGPTPTTDTSGWADALRRMTIGGERPGPPGAQFW